MATPNTRRAALAAGAALLALVIAASAPAATPSYGDWSAPVWVGAVVNSASTEQGPALSSDGLSLYFYSGRVGGVGSDDIWVSHRASLADPWGTPANLGSTINSTSRDFVPAFSPDGHWMFFASDRPGGFGPPTGTPTADIYQSYRSDIHDDFGWQTPTNLGPNVNTAANDNGVGYFANVGGRPPQLFFGSDRLGPAGSADLYLSEQQADGSWGPSTRIAELSSTATENRPSLRADGLEIFFYSTRAGGVGGTDIWTATRTSVDAAWSTPVALPAPVNSDATELHPYLGSDGRSLVFGSSRAGGLGNTDLYIATRNAQLTVTADHQSRLFGAANPTLTATISGFVGTDTSSVVSGTAACTTSATPSSPAGDYPITCSVGSLTAPGYDFVTFVAGTLTISYSQPCVTGLRTGPLHVAAGESVCIGQGATQIGPVKVATGGALDVEGGRIIGPLSATSAAAVRICGAAITGPLTITGTTGLVLIGGDGATGPCAGSTFVGPVSLTANSGGVEFNGNDVVGPLRITGNTGTLPAPDTGPVHADGNTVRGPVTRQP